MAKGQTLSQFITFHVNKETIDLNIKNLDGLLTSNPDVFNRLQEILRKDFWTARNSVVRNIQSVFANGDPMEARRAIRNIVYKKVLGGNLNIFDMASGTAKWSARQQERWDAGIGRNKKRGGNRIKRSVETARRQGYEPKARGFILRFVNAGTDVRETKYGARGAISPRNFFEPAAKAALDVISEHISQMIEKEMEKLMKEKSTN